MTEKDIKPIPKYIMDEIYKRDLKIYDIRIAKEESLIFFVRAKECPEKPFVTLEYSLKTHKVLQCYGEHDHKPSDNVLHYVNKIWLPYANKHLKQIQAAA